MNNKTVPLPNVSEDEMCFQRSMQVLAHQSCRVVRFDGYFSLLWTTHDHGITSPNIPDAGDLPMDFRLT